ncbi:MAG: hypothetical protein HY882_06655 [Deltaproteobacteria bacterium]|nr:hypothetical protein [Deltaproteobacteria bacterium]
MSDETYRKLCEAMSKMEGRYPGMDIPEFYEIARELFRAEEAGRGRGHASQALHGKHDRPSHPSTVRPYGKRWNRVCKVSSYEERGTRRFG